MGARAAVMGLVALAGIAVVVGACIERVDLPFGPASPTAVVSQAPAIGAGYGDGHTGAATVSAASTPDLCRGLAVGSASTLTLLSSGSFQTGDRVLVLQVQDLFATMGSPSPLTNAGEAGVWELHRLTAVSGTSLTLDTPLGRRYSSDGMGRSAEACRLPEYTDLTIAPGGRLSAARWNGTQGGVLGFFCSGTLTLSATTSLSASGGGFRGGAVGANDDTGNIKDVTTLVTDSTSGGQKGEGVDGSAHLAWGLWGRGNLANGAGGGNAGNGAGGGGGGGGAGGSGGQETGNDTSDPLNPHCRGMGGAPLAVPAVQGLFLGGGGGGGQSDNNVAGPGANGGGLILVFARNLAGAGGIFAYGFRGGDTGEPDADGAGGGGAGGTVVVVTSSSSFTGSIQASGGNGGSVQPVDNGEHGPGGGGGGGRIHLEGLPAGLADVSPGSHGIDPGTPDPVWGATSGSAGVIEIP